MASIGRFKIDAGSVANAALLQRHIRATLDAGDRVIRSVGCDWHVVREIVVRLRAEGLDVHGMHCDDDPPEYFIAGCSSQPIIHNGLKP